MLNACWSKILPFVSLCSMVWGSLWRVFDSFLCAMGFLSPSTENVSLKNDVCIVTGTCVTKLSGLLIDVCLSILQNLASSGGNGYCHLIIRSYVFISTFYMLMFLFIYLFFFRSMAQGPLAGGLRSRLVALDCRVSAYALPRGRRLGPVAGAKPTMSASRGPTGGPRTGCAGETALRTCRRRCPGSPLAGRRAPQEAPPRFQRLAPLPGLAERPAGPA